jgi:tetratricopeptide (TPR) repeat protein
LALASELGKSSEPDPSAYAKLIQGEVLLHKGSAREALKLFEEGQKLADTWLGRFDLGLAYLAANQFAEAYSELELCLKRRGEATALFLDDIPSYHYFPPVYYYLGRAQEGLKSPAAADSYKAYIATKEKAGHDRLLTDARRRLKQ